MKGYRLNPDAELVAKAMAGIAKRNGHCPCRIEENETTLCPCDDFIQTGYCKCYLFIKIEE